ncbi:TonB-dependent receptor [Mesonia maritima]|uniref:Outer membrane cobalamin receptor n=1 Tax=Mesonia maritima TaxID=1793873 RepID=A0ABU1K7J5_9FLAO|nr:TonB-dependent receptor [Mesonia maritima]MDR6301571.1 outer membrane cobalamin receptor [Mesonia maritima]
MKHLQYCFLMLSLNLFSQNISISLDESTTLQQLFTEIENQTEYKFAYNNQIDLNKKLTEKIAYKDIEIKELISILNRTTLFHFSVIGNNITVKSKSKTAQENYTLSGIILDDLNQPLLGANIYIKEEAKGAVTNENGYFSIKLPKGNYTVIISYVGFKEKTEQIALFSDKQLNSSMEPGDQTLEEVIITQNNKAVNIKKPQMSVNTLNMQEIKQIPVAMGEPDPLKSLLTLPGVSNAGEASSGFNVRGGAADQNLILLDGAPIYSDSHLFGFFSVFNADIVNNLELYKGGIPSRFGGRVSSVLDVNQHTGNDQKLKGTGGIGLISSKIMLEGPIEKEKGSFMIGGRTSYAHLFLKLADNDNAVQFYDLNTKLNYRLNDKNAISFSGYYGNDIFNIGDSFASTYGNTMGNIKWEHRFNEDILTHLSLFYSDYKFNLNLNSQSYEWKSDIISYGLQYDWKHYLSERIQLDYGAEAIYYEMNPGTLAPKDESSAINFNQLNKKYALQPSAYIDVNHKISEEINVRYGARYSMFYRYGPQDINTYANNHPAIYNPNFNIYEEATPTGSISYDSGEVISDFNNIEPRVSLSFALNEETSFKASYNRMAQYLHIISNSQSPTPVNMWTPSGPFIKPQLLDQYALGFFKNFSNKKYSLETEAFYKDIQNRTDYVDGADLIGNNNIEQVLLNGKARAYGLEVLLRKNTGKLTGWLSYTISRAEQRTSGNTSQDPGIANGEWYLSPYDKLHNLNFVTNYEYTDKWSFSANFSLQSGQPVTYPNGYYELGGLHVPNYSTRNENRLPTYHHLDLAATYTPKPNKNKGWQSYWVFSIYNVYNRQNAASVRFTTNEDSGINEARRLSIFGFLPSVSYNFKF